MTELVDELTDADLAAMWRSRPNRPAGNQPWFPNPNAGAPPEPDTDGPFGQPCPAPDPDPGIPEEPLDALEGRITSMAARLAAETREWLALVAEFNRRKGWAQWGMKSMPHWLSWSCSVGPGVAREYVRVATALTDLPLIGDAFGHGRLSYSKVRALTRVADRVDEATLVEQGMIHSAAQLEKVVRGYRKVDRIDRPAEQRRKARWFHDDDGMFVLSARLTADEGALLIAALEQARTSLLEDPDTVNRPTAHDCPDQGGASADVRPAPLPSDPDALVALAQLAQGAGPIDTSGDDRHLVIVHADADALSQPAGQCAESDAGATCRLEHGPGLTVAAARRLACDAAIIAWVSSATNPGAPLRLGRKTRKISRALRRALRLRDTGCQFPGCPRRRFLDAHHVAHWADGGATDLTNLVLLCARHHRAVHEDGFTLDPVPERPGHWTFRRPDGTPIPAAPEPPGRQSVPHVSAETPDPDSLRPDQHGEPFRLRDSIDAYLSNPRFEAPS